jgi:hypothetical protein
MSKSDAVERAMDRLGELRQAPAGDPVLYELRQFLRHRSNLVVAKAAAVSGHLNLRVLVPDLLVVFNKLIADASRLDRRCAALTEIVAALYKLECDEPAPYLRGIHHVQLEASFGPPVDAAATLRGLSAQGLLRTNHPGALHDVMPLLVDREASARIGAIRALSMNGGEAGVLLLKLKALQGDSEPEVVGECFAAMLAAAPDKSVDFVGRYVDSEDSSTVELAILALGESRQPSAFVFLRQKWDRTVSRPTRKLLLLAMASSRLEEAIAFLTSIVRDCATETAVDAIQALSMYRSSDRVSACVGDAVLRRDEQAVSQAFKLSFPG